LNKKRGILREKTKLNKTNEKGKVMKSIDIVSLGGKLGVDEAIKFMEELEKRIGRAGIKSDDDTTSILIQLLPKPVKSNMDRLIHLRLFTSDKDDIQKMRNALKYMRILPEDEVVRLEHVLTEKVEPVIVE
jgi:hypothetical protein